MANLNSLFHIDFSEKEIDARGSVRKIERKDEDLVSLFKEQIGYTPNDWIESVLFDGIKIESDVVEFIALEYSAACDYSNAKKRTHRYLLGAVVSAEVAKNLNNKKRNLSNAIFMLPFNFMHKGQECSLCLHFNFSINEEDFSNSKILGERLFSLKSEVMNMICDCHANHISRIGITSFN